MEIDDELEPPSRLGLDYIQRVHGDHEPGDEIVLQAGTTYTRRSILPVEEGSGKWRDGQSTGQLGLETRFPVERGKACVSPRFCPCAGLVLVVAVSCPLRRTSALSRT
jgi:hypothetical protein